MKCPKGHDLPHSVNKVQCAPNACASDNVPVFGNVVKEKKSKQRPRNEMKQLTAASVEVVDLAKADMSAAVSLKDEDAKEEVKKLGRAVSRYEARKAYMKTPEKIDDPKTYVEKRLEEMLPDAVDRLGFDLKLGDEDASRAAAKDILDRSGFGKRDGQALPGAPIVIVMGGQESKAYSPPWATRVDVKKEEK
jgi:hypothetical protein